MTNTHGPWVVNGEEVVAADGTTVADVFGSREERADLARLIAAAPALLEALTRLKQAFDITSDNFEEVEVDGEMIEPIDLKQEVAAAIAQATGDKS